MLTEYEQNLIIAVGNAHDRVGEVSSFEEYEEACAKRDAVELKALEYMRTQPEYQSLSGYAELEKHYHKLMEAKDD